MGIGQRGSLDRDRRDLLAGCEHLGHTHRDVSEEGVQRGSTLIARADGVPALLLQVLQERQNAFECQIIKVQR